MQASALPSRNRRIAGWIGWAGLDAAGRLVLLSVATVIFSRLLDADDFGISAIVLAIAAPAGLMVGAPFEDAIAQRRVIRAAHLRSALTFGLMVSVILIALSLPLAGWVASSYDAPLIALLLPVTMLSVLFSGHGDLVTARARRMQRFNDIAMANLLSHVIAVPAAVLAAFLGAGVWSLILLRLLQVIARSALLQWQVGYPLKPQLDWTRLADLRRFASLAFLDRLTDNLTYLVFNGMVASFFGLGVLGHVNMAMRLVEPIRGAIIATSHNLIFTHLRRMAFKNDDDGAGRGTPIAALAFVTSAVFAGLTAIMPLLLPLVAGPGWDTAVSIAMCLAAGGMLVLPVRPVYTSLSAAGRPEYGLISSVTGLALTCLLLFVLRDANPAAVGFSRLAGDAAQALFALLVPLGWMRWPASERVKLVLPAWLIATSMGLVSWGVLTMLAQAGAVLALAGGVVAGVAVQFVLMWLFRRKALVQLLAVFFPATRIGVKNSHE